MRKVNTTRFNVAIVSSLLLASGIATRGAAGWVTGDFSSDAFPIVDTQRVADILISHDDFEVVSVAAHDLATDIKRVTGKTATVQTNNWDGRAAAVIVGTLEKSPLIEEAVRRSNVDVSSLRNQWESFLIVAVTNPLAGVDRGLLVVGSDRRGTAYGMYELSQAIGVSPWHWWADVAPQRRDALYVEPGLRRFGPPSVKYRGIFINDEDWGLQPWAAQTFEPEHGGIGPKTYAKVFELLLRLKANTLWPAMHPSTRAFNSFPENKELADDYAIVMGSSHAEPMLRNNVGEWVDIPECYNYALNREGVLKYWEDRVAQNGRFDNIYTIGMRGIHDSAMQGAKTRSEQKTLLERIFTDQRGLLSKYVNPAVGQVPQIFCAYKEVLDVYRAGLEVPDDVTIVWPDDNFGYIRNFANASERKRSGGFGVYYHISYLGRPLSYLWLCTTPPALIREEMAKAYDHGANRLWIVNVGDIKPGEIGTEFFLQMAWDIDRWKRDKPGDFLQNWAAREFGQSPAREIASIMEQYYRLNFQRKPEHLQWWLRGREEKPSPLTDGEKDARLAAFGDLKERVDRLMNSVDSARRDALFELVAYPVRCAALANRRYFDGENSALAAAKGEEKEANALTSKAKAADAQLKEETRFFNETVAGGKWRGFLRIEPADNEWSGMRIAPWSVPKFENQSNAQPGSIATIKVAGTNPPPPGFMGFVEREGLVSIEAEHFNSSTEAGGARWEVIPGLGRSGDSVAVFPTTAPSVDAVQMAAAAPRLDYSLHFQSTGDFALQMQVLPTHPIDGSRFRLGIALDDQAPTLVELDEKDGSTAWAQGVLDEVRVMSTKLKVPGPGTHTLHVFGVDAGIVLDKMVIDCGGLKPSYLGPVETMWPGK